MISSKNVLLFGISFGILSLIILTILTLNESPNDNIFMSVQIGNLLGFLNFAIGLIFIFLGINNSNKRFLISLFGGLLLRLIIMVFLVVVILKFLEINEISFIFSLLFFYFLYVTIEIIYLNLRKS